MRSYSIALAALIAVGACNKSEPAPTPAPTQPPSRPATTTQPTTQPTRPPAPRPDTTGRPPAPRPDSTGAPGTPPTGGAPTFPGLGGAPGEPNPRPYASVITARARSKTGVFGVHQVGSTLFFEIPASEIGKDFVVTQVLAGTPAGIPASARGSSAPIASSDLSGVTIAFSCAISTTTTSRRDTSRVDGARNVADRVLPDHGVVQCRGVR